MAMKTDYLVDSSSLTPEYMTSYFVLSKTHRQNS